MMVTPLLIVLLIITPMATPDVASSWQLLMLLSLLLLLHPNISTYTYIIAINIGVS